MLRTVRRLATLVSVREISELVVRMRGFVLNRKAVVGLGILALLFSGGVLFCFVAGSVLVAPRPCLVTLPQLFTGTTVSFPSRSGATLHGNLLRGTSGKGAVILMHGVRGHRGSMAGHADFLHRAGYSVLLFDFQAHGESSGAKITSGYLESMDAAAAVDFVSDKLPEEKIAVIGSSLGGAATILADPPLRIDGAILEMVYPDIERAVKNRIAIVLGNWARPLSCLLTWQLRPRLGVRADWFQACKKVRRMNCPKLIVGGANDRHTTLADTKDLFVNATDPKELWIVENAAHQDLHKLAREEYENRILAFLDRHLSSAQTDQGDQNGKSSVKSK